MQFLARSPRPNTDVKVGKMSNLHRTWKHLSDKWPLYQCSVRC